MSLSRLQLFPFRATVKAKERVPRASLSSLSLVAWMSRSCASVLRAVPSCLVFPYHPHSLEPHRKFLHFVTAATLAVSAPIDALSCLCCLLLPICSPLPLIESP